MKRLFTLFPAAMSVRYGLLILLLLLAATARAQTYDLVVAQDGTGAYRTVQAAINAAPTGRTTPFTIFIKNGKYRERVTIPANKPFLQLTGESVANTIITYDQAAVPTFVGNTSTVIINASDITVFSITFENSWGETPQALAMYTTGDRIAFKGCRFTGGQDTVQLNAGTGLRNYFKDCYIDGTVDFIFGSARGVFENCYIYPKTRRDGGSGGYITAANTQAGQLYGFVFRKCTILDNRGTTTYTLGRPWQNDLGSTATDRSHTKVVWLNTTMGPTIKPVGWQVWDAGTVTSVITYAEYQSRDFGGNLVNVSQRLPWTIQLTDADTTQYTRAAVLGSWNPCTLTSTFCTSAPAPIVVSNFRAVKGTATAPSTLQWNLSWPVAGVQYELYRSTTRRGTYSALYTTTNAVATNVNAGTTDAIPTPGTSYYYYVRASKNGLATHITDTVQISSTPTIFTTGSLQAFLQGGSQPSAPQNVLVSGENLTAGLVVTPPSGYQVSANGGATWFTTTTPLTLTPSSAGNVASTTLSVRLNASTVGTFAGSLTLTSPGAATVTLPVSGVAQAAALPQSVPLQWWPMTRNNQDSIAVRATALVASVSTLRRFVVSSGSAGAIIPPYSNRYGQAFAPSAEGGWTAAVGGNGSNLNRTYYEQFTVMPSGSAAVRLDSLLLSSYVTGSTSGTKLAVVWSRSGFGSDSADISGGRGPGGVLLSTANGAFATPILTTNASTTYRLAFAGAGGVLLPAGQRLTFRIYFSCGSTTTSSRFATLKNVQVKGEAGVVMANKSGRAAMLHAYPNPTADVLTLTHPTAAPGAEVAIYSLLGQRVALISCTMGSLNTHLALTDLPSGQYLLRYTSGSEQFNTRVIKY
ncbi:pectinesterase family protein [Hymenobacter lucidus]|uniref:T9SS type A sorting domain-containing protein n=1 Tax=Hymenobacter lucidus TaxID=2880930 RepID=A0ABS8AWY9_9BACT|nr:pectinesterase family protein [Hymenobacter lucidus]MCB2410331.1 T9SS type A sorting domain-containing protein [Hymenobacter lucidus]